MEVEKEEGGDGVASRHIHIVPSLPVLSTRIPSLCPVLSCLDLTFSIMLYHISLSFHIVPRPTPHCHGMHCPVRPVQLFMFMSLHVLSHSIFHVIPHHVISCFLCHTTSCHILFFMSYYIMSYSVSFHCLLSYAMLSSLTLLTSTHSLFSTA
jgi:hypothetical protein